MAAGADRLCRLPARHPPRLTRRSPDTMKPNATFKRRLGLGLLAVLLLAALAFVMLRTGPLAATRVTVQPAQRASLAPALFGIGTVEARRAYLIGPTAAGRVLRVMVDVGDTVQAGQLLAEMDPVDLDERLARAGCLAGPCRQRGRRGRGAAPAMRGQQRTGSDQRPPLRRPGAAQNFVSAGALEAQAAGADLGRGGAWRPPQANLAAARQDMDRLAAERDGAAPAARQPAPARARRRRGHPARRRAGLDRGGRAGGGALVDPASLWVNVRFDQGRSAGLAAGLPAEIVLRSQPRAAAAGPGGARRAGERQRDRRAPRPGGLRPRCPRACRSASWPR